MNSHELLLALEKLGADMIEIREKGKPAGAPFDGTASSTRRGTVACYYGADDGSDDCELTPDGFNARFCITAAIFTE